MKIHAEGPRTLDTVLHPARDETVHVQPQAEMLGFTPRSLGLGSYLFLFDSSVCPETSSRPLTVCYL